MSLNSGVDFQRGMSLKSTGSDSIGLLFSGALRFGASGDERFDASGAGRSDDERATFGVRWLEFFMPSLDLIIIVKRREFGAELRGDDRHVSSGAQQQGGLARRHLAAAHHEAGAVAESHKEG
jgi:hypothetical protein